MKPSQKLHQALLNEWSIRIAEQKASGLTIHQWCEQNNVSFHKYNYWKHQLKSAVIDQVLPDIEPLALTSSPKTIPATNNHLANRANCTNRAICTNHSTVNLSINGIDFSIETSVPETFLLTLIKAARYA